MSLFSASNWLRTPADRDVIHRWTVGGEEAGSHEIRLPEPDDPTNWEFLALGDTGDSEASGAGLSPQDAVAQEMERDSALPDSDGRAAMVLHTGDVVYMTGEERLYDRNFRRPYSRFITDDSTVENFVFRIPFLPIPGNHDYYDLGHWAVWVSRIPFLRSGLRALAQRLFAFSLPEGGSGMGRAYMRAFVDEKADTRSVPLDYLPGVTTRLPNRYYRFTFGGVDFFALDSNTLDAPAADVKTVRLDAAARLGALEKRAEQLDRSLRREQATLEDACSNALRRTAADVETRATAIEMATGLVAALAELESALRALDPVTDAGEQARDAVGLAARRWREGSEDLAAATDAEGAVDALESLSEAEDRCCEALRALEACLAEMPEGSERSRLLGARADVESRQDRWSDTVTPTPPDLIEKIRVISEEALDVQRDLALERRRLKYRPEDHDAAQLRWLRESLAEAIEARPDNWRIVYLHHPLYTTIGNHVEGSDVTSVRDNLLPLLKDRVHLVVAGHAHAFEWFRTADLPETGVFTTGGGGQLSLRPSVLEPSRLRRHLDRYLALGDAGIREYAMAGNSPRAPDGVAGPLYHYLRIEVSPEVLTVRPVGVRRHQTGYRREEPMPVNHVATFERDRPPWKVRALEAVEVRRGEAPRPVFTE